MSAKKQKSKRPAVRLEVTLADIAEELKAICGKLESIRKILFYIPDIAKGAKLSHDKKTAANVAPVAGEGKTESEQ